MEIPLIESEIPLIESPEFEALSDELTAFEKNVAVE